MQTRKTYTLAGLIALTALITLASPTLAQSRKQHEDTNTKSAKSGSKGTSRSTAENGPVDWRANLESNRWRANRKAYLDKALNRATAGNTRSRLKAAARSGASNHSFRKQVTRKTINRTPSTFRRATQSAMVANGQATHAASRVHADYVHRTANRRASQSPTDYHSALGGQLVSMQNRNGTTDLLNPRTGFWNYGFKTQAGQDLYNPVTGTWNLGFTNPDGTLDYLDTRTGRWTLAVPKPKTSAIP